MIGYLVWSYTAWKKNLGLLPALDPQYFVAGIAPILILFASYMVFRYFRRFLIDVWPRLVGPQARGIWGFIRKILFFMFLAWPAVPAFGPALSLFLLILYLVYKLMKRRFPLVSFTSAAQNDNPRKQALNFAIFFFLFGVALTLLIGRDYFTKAVFPTFSKFEDWFVFGFITALIFLPPGDRFAFLMSRLYKFFVLYLGGLVLMLAGLLFYLETIYPNLPQEFGGVRPRFAYLEVKKDQFSIETLKSMTPASVKSTLNGVVIRTKKVEVLYWGGGVAIIRSSDGKIYRLHESAINAAEFSANN